MRNLKCFLTGFTLLLVACFKPDERHVGVDDFPNSIHAQVVGYLDESKKSDEISKAPGLTDSVLKFQGFNVGVGKVAVKKISAASQSGSGWMALSLGISSDTCLGSFKFDTTITGPLKTTVNSLILCVDSKLTDSIKGNETVIRGMSVTTFISGRIERTEITDADGDGKLNPIAGGKSKAKLSLVVLDNDVEEKTNLIVGPGMDNNFETQPDNLVYAAEWLKTKNAGKDTLATAVYTDADGDGIVVDNTKPSLVDLVLFEVGPTKDHADALWSKTQMRLLVIYGQTNQEPRRVRFEMESKNGHLEIAELLNADNGKEIGYNQKLKAHFKIISTVVADTLDTSETVLTMSIGNSFENKSDDSVYAIDVIGKKKLGEEVAAHFSFLSDAAIPSGQKPKNGKLSMKVTYTDSTTVDLNGVLSSKGMDVTIKDRKEKKLHVVWDELGRGLILEQVH